ncbi:hypothetical protein Ae201684P_016959 [Aphanomyces euteiches]|nr:hypothetical protein Ae201684P_016959 [Aphanomyces euteiches]
MESDGSVLEKLLEEICYRPSSATIRAHMSSCEESFKAAPQLKKTANQVLNSIFRCKQKSSAKHLLNLLDMFLLADEGFYEAFTERLIARSKSIALSFDSARILGVQMTCTVLRFKCDPNSTLAKGLLEALCTLLEMVSGNNFRLQNAAVKYVVDICKQSASTFEQLFEMICATPSTANIEMGSTKFRATKILIENFVGLLEPNNRLRLLSNFTFWAFESKYRPRASELKSFDDFLNTVSSEEFAAVVEPVMSRMLKKSPDSLLEATTLMTSALRFDFDRYIDNVFIPIFTLKIRSQKDDVRDNCVGLIEAVISRCGDLRPAQTILVELLNVLEGKHGILAQSYQREAVFLSLYNISKHLDSLDSSGAIELANLCIPRLIKAF